MKFASMKKVSTVDYPKKIVTTLFTAGCNFRCSYCHNYQLISADIETAVEEKEIFAHLEKRRGVIDGICITGGEPSLWGEEVLDFIKRIKAKMGNEFLVKVDTNGSAPWFIEGLHENADFVAVDLKSLDYTGFSDISLEVIRESLEKVKRMPDYEVRFTMFPNYIREEDFERLGKLVQGMKKAAVQQFNPINVLEENAKEVPRYKNEVLEQFAAVLRKYVNEVEIRGI